MTKFTPEQIERIKDELKGRKIADIYYEEDGDYYVINLDSGSEFSFRFMADLI